MLPAVHKDTANSQVALSPIIVPHHVSPVIPARRRNRCSTGLDWSRYLRELCDSRRFAGQKCLLRKPIAQRELCKVCRLSCHARKNLLSPQRLYNDVLVDPEAVGLLKDQLNSSFGYDSSNVADKLAQTAHADPQVNYGKAKLSKKTLQKKLLLSSFFTSELYWKASAYL